MKSETVSLQDKRTNFRMVEVKSDKIQDSKGESEEKILGLFDDNSFREDEVFLTRSNSGLSSSKASLAETNLFIFPLILTLLLNFCQLSET